MVSTIFEKIRNNILGELSRCQDQRNKYQKIMPLPAEAKRYQVKTATSFLNVQLEIKLEIMTSVVIFSSFEIILF